MCWLFAYGPSVRRDFLRTVGLDWTRAAPAQLPEHAYRFSGVHPERGGGTSTLVPMAGATVLGAAYAVDSKQVDRLVEATGNRHSVRAASVLVDGSTVTAQMLVRDGEAQPNHPADTYLSAVREGLCEFHDTEIVFRYLDHAIRFTGEAEPYVDRDSATAHAREYGADFRRLAPTDATLSSPFGAAWAQLAPKEASTPHSHDEEEVFLFLDGQGSMSIDGRTAPVTKGDMVYLEPFSAHTVTNVGDGLLSFLCIWWNAVDPTDPGAAP